MSKAKHHCFKVGMNGPRETRMYTCTDQAKQKQEKDENVEMLRISTFSSSLFALVNVW